MRSVSHEIKLTANTYVARGVEGVWGRGGGLVGSAELFQRDASRTTRWKCNQYGPLSFFHAKSVHSRPLSLLIGKSVSYFSYF